MQKYSSQLGVAQLETSYRAWKRTKNKKDATERVYFQLVYFQLASTLTVNAHVLQLCEGMPTPYLLGLTTARSRKLTLV